MRAAKSDCRGLSMKARTSDSNRRPSSPKLMPKSPGVIPYSLGPGFWTLAPRMVAGMRASSAGSGWLVKRGVGSGVTDGELDGVADAGAAVPPRVGLGVGVAGPGSAVEQAASPRITATRTLATARGRGRAAAEGGVGMGLVRIAAAAGDHVTAGRGARTDGSGSSGDGGPVGTTPACPDRLRLRLDDGAQSVDDLTPQSGVRGSELGKRLSPAPAGGG